MKKIKLILSIFLLAILFAVTIFYIKNKNTKPQNNLINIVGTIEDKKITLEEQYLYVKDGEGNKIKINITENTNFKEKLKLEEGDKINIKGKYIDKLILQAEEISNFNQNKK